MIFFVCVNHARKSLCDITCALEKFFSDESSDKFSFAFLHAEYMKMNFSRENRNENGRRKIDEHEK